MIDYILVLSAGRGERLGNLTVTTPKPLLEINSSGDTILLRLLDQISRNFPTIPTYVNISYLADSFLKKFICMDPKIRPKVIFEQTRVGPMCTVVEFAKTHVGNILIFNGDLVLEDTSFDEMCLEISPSTSQVIVCHSRNKINARSEVFAEAGWALSIKENDLEVAKTDGGSLQENVLVSSGIYKINGNLIKEFRCELGMALSPLLLNYVFQCEPTKIYFWKGWRYSVDSIDVLKTVRSQLNI